MSFIGKRKTAVLKYDEATQTLHIKDSAFFYRMVQMILLGSSTCLVSVFIFKEVSISWVAILAVVYIVFAVLVIGLYVVKTSTTNTIAVNDIEELIITKILMSSSQQLSIKLKNGKYRNLMGNDNNELAPLIRTFKDLEIPVNPRRKYQLLPLNY